jgi:hypothetical protein
MANSIRARTADGGQRDEEATANGGSQATASDSPRNRTVRAPMPTVWSQRRLMMLPNPRARSRRGCMRDSTTADRFLPVLRSYPTIEDHEEGGIDWYIYSAGEGVRVKDNWLAGKGGPRDPQRRPWRDCARPSRTLILSRGGS